LAIQRLLAGMAERWMSDVVDQRQGFDQLFIRSRAAAAVRAI